MIMKQHTVKFVAGWNTPGYLPDNEPAEFETFDAAKRYIITEMLETAESTDENISEMLTHAAEDANLESRPFSYTVNGIAFWVAYA